MVDIEPVRVAPDATKVLLKSAVIVFADGTATLHGVLTDGEGNELKGITAVMNKEEYAQWSDDDDYAVKILLEKNAIVSIK